MTENDVNPPINNDPMEKRNEFIDHPSYNPSYSTNDFVSMLELVLEMWLWKSRIKDNHTQEIMAIKNESKLTR